MHTIDGVLMPLEASDNQYRWQPVSVKNLMQCDYSWSIIKLVLSWIIDTVNMSIYMPPDRPKHLSKIIASIPINTQYCKCEEVA